MISHNLSNNENSFNISLYKQLRRNIKKNKTIPSFIKKLTDNSLEIQKLKDAILNENTDHPIFNDDNCLLYLLYLIKHQQLVNNQATTLLVYLMAKKSGYDVSIIKINEEKNESLKKQLINDMVTKSAKSKIILDENVIAESIANLKGIDAWIIKTNIARDSDERRLMEEVFKGSGPCLLNNDKEYIIPSIEIITRIMKLINPSPINFFVMLGIISLQTLMKMHAARFHPLEIHGAPFVLNNLEEAHDVELTPLAMLLHDIYHTYSGSLLSLDEHNYVFMNLIPKLTALIAELKKIEGMENFDLINMLQEFLYDLNDMSIGASITDNNEFQKTNDSRFEFWIKDKFNRVAETTAINDDAVELEKIVRFYYELYTSSLADDEMIMQLFSQIMPDTANRIADIMRFNDADFQSIKDKAITKTNVNNERDDKHQHKNVENTEVDEVADVAANENKNIYAIKKSANDDAYEVNDYLTFFNKKKLENVKARNEKVHNDPMNTHNNTNISSGKNKK